jgi:hypothetical protein
MCEDVIIVETEYIRLKREAIDFAENHHRDTQMKQDLVISARDAIIANQISIAQYYDIENWLLNA